MIWIDWRRIFRRREPDSPDALALHLAKRTPYGLADLVEYAVACFRKGLSTARAESWLLNAQRYGQRMNLNAQGTLVMACRAVLMGYVTADPAGDAEAAVKAMEGDPLAVEDWRD